MSLASGTRLGHYEVVAPIGAGGMGEVYRAKDTQLKRDVALKVLPAALATNADRLARFQREAELLAALNHPNIAHIYGFEYSQPAGSEDPALHSDGAPGLQPRGIPALVMELVEGPTLAERIARGPVPISDALPIAQQLAQALEYAHERGIIHRDLKPANIKITPDGDVKVLDFGLAKALAPDLATSAGDLEAANSPTITTPAMTEAGIILGTAAYMSPEQARGAPVDKRTDIWAFGVVLYEMLTGRRAFEAASVTDTIAAVVLRDPDWSGLPQDTPRLIRRLLTRCLTKDRKQRLHDIADARLEIDDAPSAPPGDEVDGVALPASVWSRRSPWIVAGVASSLAAFLGVAAFLDTGTDRATGYFQILPPNSTAGVAPEPALSPDGKSVVFRARDASGATTLWLRRFDSENASQLPKTEDAELPFWSPDSQTVAFFDMERGKLKRIELADGTVQILADVANPRGGSWSRDGMILYAPVFSGLYEVPASGESAPSPVTSLSGNILGHLYPHFLPDGRRFLYLEQVPTSDRYVLCVGSLDSAEVQKIEGVRSRAEYSEGYLLFGDRGTVYAQAFDAERLQFSGVRARIADGMGVSFGELSSAAFSATGQAVVTANGWSLADTQLVVVDRQGRRVRTLGEPAGRFGLALEPRGTRVAVEGWDPVDNKVHISLVDTASGLATQFAAGSPYAGTPVWSTTGDRILYTDFAGQYFIQSVSDDTNVHIVEHVQPGSWLMGWSPDEKNIIFNEVNVGSGGDIMVLPLSPRSDSVAYLPSVSREREGNLSRDGQWLAYISDEYDRFEVYVDSFPTRGHKKRISELGGRQPVWGADGKELYYIRADGQFMAVSLTEGSAGLIVTQGEALFPAPQTNIEIRLQYGVLDRGQAFIFNEISETVPRVMTFVRNWRLLVDR